MPDPRPPLSAWSFQASDDRLDVCFARSEAGARAIFARRHGLTFAETDADPQPKFDATGRETGDQPSGEQFLDAGWLVWCSWCEHQVEADGCWKCEDEREDEDAEPEPPVTEGEWVYCSQRCRDEEAEHWANVKALKAMATEALRAKYPFVVPLRAWVGGFGEDHDCYKKNPDCVVVDFKVPGGTLSEKTADGNACFNHFCAGCGHAWVARGDLEAFKALLHTAPDCVVEAPP